MSGSMTRVTLGEVLNQLLKLFTVAAWERRGVGCLEGENVLQLRQNLPRALLGLVGTGIVDAQRSHFVYQLVGFLFQLPATHKMSSINTR